MQQDEEKDLGVIIDHKLTFTKHIQNQVNKIRTYNPVFSLLSGDVMHDTQTLPEGARGVGSDARTAVGDDDTGEIETFVCEENEGCDEARGGSGRARRRGRSHDERRVGSVGGDRSIVSPLFSY